MYMALGYFSMPFFLVNTKLKKCIVKIDNCKGLKEMATLTKEQYAQLKGQGRKNYIPQTTGQQTVITADKFIGELQGNASTASALDHAITLSLGGDASGSVQINANNARLDATIHDSEHANNADTAENAKHSAQASHADLANIATLALRSILANNATHADRASNADNADHSDEATHADSADSASRATYDSNGDNIHNTFVDKQRQITANTNSITGHSSTLTNHEERLGTAEDKIDDLDTRVDNIETSTDVGQLTTRIVNIENKNLEQDNRLDAINDSMVTLTTAQYVSGIKRFNQSKVEMSNDPIGIDVTNKDYVDNKTLSSSQWVRDYTDNRILSSSTYVKEYTDNRILSTSKYVDDNFMSLTKSQYVLGLNTFDKLPQSGAVPVNANDFITKKYFDENHSSGHALFDVVAKDHVLIYGKDLEGFAPLGTWVYKTAVDGTRYGYPDFVQKCLDEYEEATADTITVDSITLNIKRHSNGHIFFDVADIEIVNTIYQARGEAWFYGIDETNERVFLPRSTRIKFGDVNTVGDYQEAGLPSIEHTHVFSYLSAPSKNGQPDGGTDSGSYGYWRNGNTWTSNTSNNNSTVSSIYGKSNTVEYSSTKLIPYMVVGNVKSDNGVVDVVDVTTTNNDTVPLFMAHYVDYKPNNLSWLKGGAQKNNGGLYATCYNELVNVLNGETKYGSLKVIDASDMVEGEDYSLYWIVDQVNETFRTPTKTQQRFVVKTYQNGTDWYRIYNDGWCEQGSRTAMTGTSMDVYLLKPFLSSEYTVVITHCGQTMDTEGATASTDIFGSSPYSWGQLPNYFRITHKYSGSKLNWVACGYIDLSNETFDTSLYFKVANAVENIELLDVGAVTEALSGKVDNTNTEWAINALMPDLTAGVSTSLNETEQIYTCPSDGWVSFDSNGGNANGGNRIAINGVTISSNYTSSTSYNSYINLFIPVKKNDICVFRGGASRATGKFIFYPCLGAN